MKRLIWTGLAALVCAGGLRAATTAEEDLAERKGFIRDFYRKTARVYTEPLNKVNSFMTGSYGFAPPVARDRWKVHASVGFGRGTTQVDKSSAYSQVATTEQYFKDLVRALPESFDIPAAIVNAHLGLPPFLFYESAEVGLHIASLSSGDDFKLSVVGIDVRGNIFEQSSGSPLGVMVGVSLDNNNSHLGFSSKEIVLNEPGDGSLGSFSRTGLIKRSGSFDMQNTAFTVRGVLSRDLLPSRRFALRPFVGAGAQMNSGITEVRFFDTGSVTSKGPSPSTATATSTEMIEGMDSVPVSAIDLRLAGGLEINLWKFYAAYVFEYGAVSGGTAGNFQLGVAF